MLHQKSASTRNFRHLLFKNLLGDDSCEMIGWSKQWQVIDEATIYRRHLRNFDYNKSD